MTIQTNTALRYQISDWRVTKKNTLQATFTLTIVGLLAIRGCMLHQKNEKRWVAFPAKEFLEQGKLQYTHILDVSEEIKQKALAAVDRHVGS